ncbi:MAG: hypothetical protein ACR650_09680 [Methylocystis sp.]
MVSFLDLLVDLGNAATLILTVGLVARDGFAVVAMWMEKRGPALAGAAFVFAAMIWRAVFMLAIFGLFSWITGFPFWPRVILAALRN